MKRIKLSSINGFKVFCTVFPNPKFVIEGIKLSHIVLWDFFIAQFHPFKRKSKRQPVAQIDHPLDKNIPFTPEWVHIYLDFIKLWVFGVVWMRRYFGPKAMKHIYAIINDMKKLYNTASEVYLQCQSTTIRPPKVKGFGAIHATDPHLHCLPSLHVMIVIYTGFFFPKVIEKIAAEVECTDDFTEENNHFRKQALLITESILYVKQHSINCIPAAFFTLKNLFPGIEAEYGTEYLAELLAESKPAVTQKEKISAYMVSLYKKFEDDLENRGDKDFVSVMVNFLFNYKSQ